MHDLNLELIRGHMAPLSGTDPTESLAVLLACIVQAFRLGYDADEIPYAKYTLGNIAEVVCGMEWPNVVLIALAKVEMESNIAIENFHFYKRDFPYPKSKEVRAFKWFLNHIDDAFYIENPMIWVLNGVETPEWFNEEEETESE